MTLGCKEPDHHEGTCGNVTAHLVGPGSEMREGWKGQVSNIPFRVTPPANDVTAFYRALLPEGSATS